LGSYSVNEIFLTLHGEDLQACRQTVFCRFAGCNLWSRREEDRNGVVCQFCDPDFVGTSGTKGGRYRAAEESADAIEIAWTGGPSDRFCVLTGDEPLLEVDEELVRALHDRRFRAAIETNGALAAPAGIDWVCVSPQWDAAIAVTRGDELKLVYPQNGAPSERFADLAFDNIQLQPTDGGDMLADTREAIGYCLCHPKWRLSAQTHEHLGTR